ANNAFTQVGIGSGGDPGGTSYLKDLPANPGADFIVATDQNFANVYLGSGVNFSSIQQISSISPANKFSVTDDGSAIFYVGTDKLIHAIVINFTNGNVQDVIISNDAIWSNVAISKDGKRFAAITDEGINELWVYDYTIQSWKTFTLFNPTYTEGVTTGDVLYPDVLDWDYSGNYVMYDALNQIKDANNNIIEYWDISFIRAFDKNTTQYGDGEISKLFNGLAENTSIGNPSFSKNSPYIIGFDFVDETANENDIVNANIETGDYGFIINQGEVGYPSFSKLDDYIIFNTITDNIGFAKLGTNKITYANSKGNIFTDARWGNWFANGIRDINIATNEQLDTKQNWSLNPTLASGQIRITSQETTEKGVIQVFDALGRQVLANELEATQSGADQIINVSNINPGNYFVRIQAGKSIQTSRFIKN
ncbi:MAG TPA: T9SS type A sorting domain-containing protein, partial [Saprospiraceae bacterium]|nr:T9SS type A sorting domain-containing protein [Saprospiraceae bacterium]